MKQQDPEEALPASQTVHGDGSVAHQIVGAFLVELSEKEGYSAVSKRLANVLFQTKVSEDDLRIAIFGEVEL